MCDPVWSRDSPTAGYTSVCNKGYRLEQDPAHGKVRAVSYQRLAIVVVNFGSSALLEQNLEPLASATPDAEVVVVDNFSDDEERRRVVEQARDRWHTVLPDSNPGFGAGMNLGVRAARELGADRFLLLNPDATLAPDQLQTLMKHSSANRMALIAPRILRPDGSTWSAGSDLYLTDGRIRSRGRRISDARIQEWLTGACLLISHDLWEAVGGFRDGYFLYWEDVDLSTRVQNSGGDLMLISEAVAVHAEGGTQGKGHDRAGNAKSTSYYRFNIRNRMVYAAFNLPTPLLRAWRRSIIPIAFEVLLQGGRRQFLQSPKPLWAAVRGCWEAYAIAGAELRRRAGPSVEQG